MQKEYVWLGDRLIAIGQGTSLFYADTDHLGTPRGVVNAAGTEVWRMTPITEPFGNVQPNQDPGNTGTAFVLNLRFPGQYYDQETGLAQNWFRDYNSATGRYPISDPIGLGGGINTYAYVKGSPLMYVDPDGKNALIVAGGIIVACYKVGDFLYQAYKLGEASQQNAKNLSECATKENECDANKLQQGERDMYGQAGVTAQSGNSAVSTINSRAQK